MTDETTEIRKSVDRPMSLIVRVATLAAIVSIILAANYFLVNTSVRANEEQWKDYLIADCARSVSMEYRGETDALRLKTKAKMLDKCAKIEIKRIDSSGGFIGPVNIQVELSGSGYVPEGRPSRDLMTSSSCVFPLTLYYVVVGEWPLAEHPEATDPTIEL